MPLGDKANLSAEQCQLLLSDLIDDSVLVDGERKLARGAARRLAIKFETSERTVLRLFAKAKERRRLYGYYSCSPWRKGKCGRRPIYDRAELTDAVEDLPAHERQTQRSLSAALGVCKTTVQRLLSSEKVIMPHSVAIKPYLTIF